MLALYPKYIRRFLILGVVLVAVIIAVLTMNPAANRVMWIAMGFLGIAAMFVSASTSAAQEHGAELSRLYDKLDAEGFVKDYSRHLDQKKIFEDTDLMVRMHLSNAYAALGAFDKAMEILENYVPKKKKKNEEAELLNRFAVVSNLCYCAEQQKNIEKAKDYLTELLELRQKLDAIQEKKPMNKRMAFNTELNEQCMQWLETGKADVEILKHDVMAVNKQMLPKITTSLWIARAYLSDNQRREAEKLLKRIVELAPNLYPGREAAKLLETLPKQEKGKQGQ